MTFYPRAIRGISIELQANFWSDLLCACIHSDPTALRELNTQSWLDQGFPPSSQLILSLLNNVLTCSTGKEDGIDVTYRLLANRRGDSEQNLRQDRLREEVCEYLQEEMRCRREGFLNGEGPVVRALLEVSDDAKIEEPPHQAKYLGNLLGPEVGTFLEGKSITFDQNGGSVSSVLRECPKQKALDTLYQHHIPEDSICDFHERFNAIGFEGKIDGKNTTSDILAEFLPEELGNPNYFIYDKGEEDDVPVPTSITPLAIAELLLRTNILEVLEKN